MREQKRNTREHQGRATREQIDEMSVSAGAKRRYLSQRLVTWRSESGLPEHDVTRDRWLTKGPLLCSLAKTYSVNMLLCSLDTFLFRLYSSLLSEHHKEIILVKSKQVFRPESHLS